ncbi:MAG: Glu/Leu/Phe/Val dehydrogenase [bacterium]|nr:Glu/Leu/Phe/Val dehydrogenase [bacterium]
MGDNFVFCDDLGPAKIIQVYEPKSNLQGVLVIDNIALGPALGGLRMGTGVTTRECFRLARSMSLKNAAAGLAHGGGKSIIKADPNCPPEQKEQLLRAMASALRDEKDYIFAPDMGTDEACMAIIRDETKHVTSLPRELGGIPLDEIGATAWGLRHAAETALGFCRFHLEDARIVIQGFGNVGLNVAKFLSEAGAIVVAAADIDGAIFNYKGLNVPHLVELASQKKSVSEYPDGQKLDNADLVDIESDIWIPAAQPDVITKDNVNRLKTKLVVPGANIGVTPEAEQVLHDKGILCLPDFIANSGGVICAAMEHSGSCESSVFPVIEEKIKYNTQQVIEASRSKGVLPRAAAEEMAFERIRKAMTYKRWSVY